MRLPITLFAIISFAIAPLSHAGSAQWQKVHDKNGVIVYQRNLEGVDTISLRGETTISALPQDIVDAMADNSQAHEWMPLVELKRDLRQISATERIEYTLIDMPWPLVDRYFVNRGKVEHLASGVVRISVKSVDEPLVREEDKVLGVLHHSEFVLTPLADGRGTHMTLEINSDPRGLIPKWLVNSAQRSWPIKFFGGLTEQLAKRGKLRANSISH